MNCSKMIKSLITQTSSIRERERERERERDHFIWVRQETSGCREKIIARELIYVYTLL